MPMPTFAQRMRGWLVLSRGSNLPTVWSNCLAGWWLGGYLPGGESWGRLAALILGASALYTAGMFLNDVFDEGFDRLHRPSRPIVAALVSRRAAMFAACGLLAAGTLLLGTLGWKTLLLAVALDALIVLYDWLHKRTSAGLALMAGCRCLLYPLATAASSGPQLAAGWGEGLLLAAYIFGLSALARGAHLPDRRPPRWPWLLLTLPVVCNALLAARLGGSNLVLVLYLAFWLFRVFYSAHGGRSGGRVASLLAGIPFVDLSAVAACTVFLPWPGWFAVLFVLALVFQRFVPAT